MSNEIVTYGKRDDIKELAERLQKMMPGAARFTESEALAVAQVAVSHGLDPFNGEVWGIKYQRNNEWVWAGVMVGVKGLRKSARRQGIFWTEMLRAEPKRYAAPETAVVYECYLRDTERVQAYGKAINALTSSGVPYQEAVQMLGKAPVYVGVGIATPDEHSKMGIHARARKRAEADAIKQAYDVQFGGAMLENGGMIVEGNVTVLGYDDDHQLPQADPRDADTVLSELGYEKPAELPEQTVLFDPTPPATNDTNVYAAIVAANLSENEYSAKNALKMCATGYDTPEKAIAWMRIYRGWRDTGADSKTAAAHANMGELP